jgi:multiple sugar transport system permease protein
VIWPILASIRLSLFAWDGLGPKRFVGLANYRELLADPVFHTALVNNLIWLAAFFIAPVLGLGLALFLSQSTAGMRLYRPLFFVPFVMSQAVIGLVFAWFLNVRFGLLARLFGFFGLEPLPLLESAETATYAVVATALWPQTAYCMILYLAGLGALDQEQIDAARLDGARGWPLLRHVGLPQLRPATLIAVLVSIVAALRSFDIVSVMTNGGPYNSSTVLAYYMYEQSFLASRYGYGAAIATVLFVLMDVCIIVFLLATRQRRRS